MPSCCARFRALVGCAALVCGSVGLGCTSQCSLSSAPPCQCQRLPYRFRFERQSFSDRRADHPCRFQAPLRRTVLSQTRRLSPSPRLRLARDHWAVLRDHVHFEGLRRPASRSAALLAGTVCQGWSLLTRPCVAVDAGLGSWGAARPIVPRPGERTRQRSGASTRPSRLPFGFQGTRLR